MHFFYILCQRVFFVSLLCLGKENKSYNVTPDLKIAISR